MPRDQWPPSALRAFWEPLRDLAEQRLKSPQHESRWFNLAGFCLRPGTRLPLDEIRIKALWPVFHQGVKHVKDVQCWAEWWILWRRVAAGPEPAAPRRDLSPARPVPAARQGRQPGQEGRPAQARAARAGRDVALRRQPGAAGARGQGGAGRRRWSRSSSRPSLGGSRPLVPGPARRAGAALRAGEHGRPHGGRRALDRRSARPRVRPRPRDDRRHLRPGPARPRLRRPRPRPRRRRSASRSSTASTQLGADEAILRPVREYHELEAAQEGQALGDCAADRACGCVGEASPGHCR